MIKSAMGKKYPSLKNINPNYSRTTDGYNCSQDFFAYIDEAGDENFDNTKQGYREWFTVSAFIVSKQNANMLLDILKNFSKAKLKDRPLYKMSFKELKHNQSVELFAQLSNIEYQTIHCIFHKPSLIENNHSACRYPSMYFYGTLDLLERISWLTKQEGKRKTHILISSRNHIKTTELEGYLFEKSLHSGSSKNMIFPERIGQTSLSNSSNHPLLNLGDYAASAMYQTLNPKTSKLVVEKIFFDTLLKEKIFSSEHPKYKGIWGNGIKCIPEVKDKILYKDILEEGSHKT